MFTQDPKHTPKDQGPGTGSTSGDSKSNEKQGDIDLSNASFPPRDGGDSPPIDLTQESFSENQRQIADDYLNQQSARSRMAAETAGQQDLSAASPAVDQGVKSSLAAEVRQEAGPSNDPPAQTKDASLSPSR